MGHIQAILKSKTISLWQGTSQEAFEATKEFLAALRVLALYNPQLPFVLACDAPPYGLGAVLAHRYHDGSEKPVAYVSHTFSAAENNYSQIEKEGGKAVAFVPLWLNFHCSY